MVDLTACWINQNIESNGKEISREEFSPGKTANLRREISTFFQADTAFMYEQWERYKELLRKCPQHGLPNWIQVQNFYNGLNQKTLKK